VVGAGVVVCLEHARCRQLYDLYIKSMTYMLFLFQIISFKKNFFNVSLGNNFYTVFVELLSCGGLWATAQFVPPLNPALLYCAFFSSLWVTDKA